MADIKRYYTVEGRPIRYFSTGGAEYTVTEQSDGTYGYVYRIYRMPELPEEEPVHVYPTIYREEAVEVFVQNIFDSNIEYDMNL